MIVAFSVLFLLSVASSEVVDKRGTVISSNYRPKLSVPVIAHDSDLDQQPFQPIFARSERLRVRIRWDPPCSDEVAIVCLCYLPRSASSGVYPRKLCQKLHGLCSTSEGRLSVRSDDDLSHSDELMTAESSGEADFAFSIGVEEQIVYSAGESVEIGKYGAEWRTFRGNLPLKAVFFASSCAPSVSFDNAILEPAFTGGKFIHEMTPAEKINFTRHDYRVRLENLKRSLGIVFIVNFTVGVVSFCDDRRIRVLPVESGRSR